MFQLSNQLFRNSFIFKIIRSSLLFRKNEHQLFENPISGKPFIESFSLVLIEPAFEVRIRLALLVGHSCPEKKLRRVSWEVFFIKIKYG